ncbi:PAS domain-containing protein [Halosolutus gelatinilyticus]|uniref:PAS domain-containing protein n=1 Tax=Halosolutus gelatinilyticus TaxID=2931975 RepID=UPI001FF3D48B|nr:PAS domain-containing protein [Halosolutus gelatinilyticus]
MGSSSPTDLPLSTRVRRQEAIAELGQQALETDGLDELLSEAATIVVETIESDYCGVFEVLPDGNESVLRAGTGWRPGLVGSATVSATRGSPIGDALRAEEPVVDDLCADDRDTETALLADHGVERGVSVPIGPADEPWGVLGAYSTANREIERADTAFVERIADVLGSAIENERAQSEREEIFERISDAVFALDEEWRFTYLNDRAYELINPDDRPLLGTRIWETFPDATDRRFESAYERAMYEQEPVSFEEYYPEPLDAWFEVRAYPSETGLSVYFRDITDRKERERRLEEAEQRYRTLVEHFPNGAVALVDEDLRYVTFGGTPVGETDVTRADLEGASLRDVLPPHLEDVVVPHYEAALDGTTARFERVIDDRTYQFHFVPVRDDDGKIFAAMGMSQDVTERIEAKRNLEQSEQRYRTLAEYFPNGIVTLFDRDQTYTLAAGRGFADIPVEPADLEGQRFDDVWPDETAATLEPAFEAALDGEEESIELAYAGREWILHAVPITDEDGDVFAGMTMAQDITEQKERERYLQDAKSQLEAATEAGAVGTWEWDVQADEMVVGPSFARTFGVDPAAAREGVSLDRFIEAIHEDDRDRVVAQIEHAVESGGEYESEYRVWNDDGELRWVVARGRVECDEEGNPVTFPGALTDITERKRAELELQRNKDQLESLFEILPVGVVVADGDGRLVEANDTAREIWGGAVFDAESIEEYEKYPVTWADSGERVESEGMTLARVLGGEEVTDPDIFEIEAADGERRIIRAEGMPVRNEDGEVTRGVVTITDITERRENQRKLAESERRYRTLVEHFPNGAVGLFDENLQYQAAGGSAFDEIGADAETVVGQTLQERYPPDIAAQLEPRFRAALEGETNAFELSIHDRDWVAYTVPIGDDTDEISRGMILVQNVTKQKRRERALRERERSLERYKKYTDDILDAIEDVFYVIDEDGSLQRWNRSLSEVTGYTDEEIASMSPRSFFDDDDRESIGAAFREGFETGSVSIELDVYTKDGDAIPFEFVASRLEDPLGDTILAGIARDVTDRVERQRALEESERRYRTLAQHFPNGAVGVYDRDLEYTLAAGAELGETLPTADRLEGDRMPEIFPAEAVADLEPLFRAAVEDGETGSVKTTLEGRNWRVWATPLRDSDGEIFAGLSFAQDVTERTEYQRKLEASNERLEQFAYAASHDLQEPLRMVTSYLQLIERRYGDALDADGEEFLAFAVDGADRMREMIDGLLEYSRVESRGDPFEPMDLNAILEDVLADLQLRIQESRAEITAEDLPRATGDASQVRQVFQNLLENAITYSGDEPPRVHVSAERPDGDAEWVISVRDEGIGIDSADQDRVFTIFDRLHNHEEYEGAGIGLALCERIVQRHGGEIWVESEPGAGSTFSFALPAADDREG